MELISVVVPVYNAEKYIEDCIKSIVHSTYPNIEIIVINDGSIDKTQSICEKIKNNYDNISVLNIKNSGVSIARNLGIAVAKGKYIVFVDGDDYVSTQYIQELYNHIQEADLSICGYCLYNDEKKQISSWFDGIELYSDIENFYRNIAVFLNPPYLLGPCFKMFKTEIIKKNRIRFPIGLSYGEDAIFVLSYLNYVKKVYSFKDFGYYYRKHGKQTLSSLFRTEMLKNDILINNMLFKQMNNYKISNAEEIYNLRTLESFYLYCVRLMNSMEVNKKDIFYHDLRKIDKTVLKKSKKLKYLGIKIAMRQQNYFIVMHLYQIKPLIKRLIGKEEC